MEINSDSSKSLAQAARVIFLIDEIRRSVDSTVKIDQSEGIADPAILEQPLLNFPMATSFPGLLSYGPWDE